MSSVGGASVARLFAAELMSRGVEPTQALELSATVLAAYPWARRIGVPSVTRQLTERGLDPESARDFAQTLLALELYDQGACLDDVLRVLREGSRDTGGTLANALDDPSAEVRQKAAYTLLWIGSEGAAACQKLHERLNDQDPKVRALSARALYFIRMDVKAPVATNVELLRHEDPKFRIMACASLRQMGRDAASAAAHLERALDDTSSRVRREARGALDFLRRQK